jgi:hypothetical protein
LASRSDGYDGSFVFIEEEEGEEKEKRDLMAPLLPPPAISALVSRLQRFTQKLRHNASLVIEAIKMTNETVPQVLRCILFDQPGTH